MRMNQISPVPVVISRQFIGVAGVESREDDRFAVFGDEMIAFDGNTTELARGGGGAGKRRA